MREWLRWSALLIPLALLTGTSAECLGQGKNLGTLTPGRQADFIVLDADPLEDIKNTRRIRGVWQRGEEVRGPRDLPPVIVPTRMLVQR